MTVCNNSYFYLDRKLSEKPRI